MSFGNIYTGHFPYWCWRGYHYDFSPTSCGIFSLFKSGFKCSFFVFVSFPCPGIFFTNGSGHWAMFDPVRRRPSLTQKGDLNWWFHHDIAHVVVDCIFWSIKTRAVFFLFFLTRSFSAKVHHFLFTRAVIETFRSPQRRPQIEQPVVFGPPKFT